MSMLARVQVYQGRREQLLSDWKIQDQGVYSGVMHE